MPKHSPHPLAATLGQNIALRRKARGLQQVELADMLEIGSDSLSRIEKGSVVPRLLRLQEIANALECSVADLFRCRDDTLEDRVSALAVLLNRLSPPEQEEVLAIMERIIAFKNNSSG